MAQIVAALGALVLFSILVIAGGLLFSLPVWLLWNYCLVGAVAGVSQVTWLQAWVSRFSAPSCSSRAPTSDATCSTTSAGLCSALV